jgi:hypothetical protein
MTELLVKFLVYSMVVAVCIGLTFHLYAPEVDLNIWLAILFLFIGAIISLLVRTVYSFWKK